MPIIVLKKFDYTNQTNIPKDFNNFMQISQKLYGRRSGQLLRLGPQSPGGRSQPCRALLSAYSGMLEGP